MTEVVREARRAKRAIGCGKYIIVCVQAGCEGLCIWSASGFFRAKMECRRYGLVKEGLASISIRFVLENVCMYIDSID